MKYRPRINYTDAQKELMRDRWQKGDSLEKIAQLFDRCHGSVARRKTKGYVKLRNTSGTIQSVCCVDRLNPQP